MRMLLILALCILSIDAAADPPLPEIPAGLDAYRMWDKWPQQRIGARAYMRGTYDRSGGNEGADASHFLYQEAKDFNVTLDVEGAGVIYFVRTNHWHGSPWTYEVDGTPHIITESSTATPNKPVRNSVFLPEAALPSPLTYTWSTTKGADLNWVPMPFRKSFRLAYGRTHYGTGYYIFHKFLPDAPLSQPLTPWDAATPPDTVVLKLLASAGEDISPPGLEAKPAELKENTLIWRDEGAGQLRKIKITLPRERALELERAQIRMTWDGRATASVDAPLCLFFGAGTLYKRGNREYLVKALPVNIRFVEDEVFLECYFPMPYFHAAEVALHGQDLRGVQMEIATERIDAPANHLAYFHATYQDHPEPVIGESLVFLGTTDIEGSRDWTGSFIGTSWIFSHNAVLNTLEGDPRFFFDDAQSPQAYGTGTEEWGGGGDYWGGRNMTLPLAGHPCGASKPELARDERDLIQSAYRFLLADLMPFGKNARITLEHGGENTSTEHYESVTYWYGLPGASLVLTDTLDVGDTESESAHHYYSPEASEPETISSRYELGPDSLPDHGTVFPAHEEVGRHTETASEFTLALASENCGVMLRRTFDYQYPNQRAEVFISNADGDPQWKPAGIWYTAGSNTCVYSNPREELGETQHNVQTSNRRFRQDEFLIAAALTQGKQSIRVRVLFTPVPRPLFPGHPLSELAWSEIRYDAYSYVLPPLPSLADQEEGVTQEVS
jgi:hypothetical protein